MENTEKRTGWKRLTVMIVVAALVAALAAAGVIAYFTGRSQELASTAAKGTVAVTVTDNGDGTFSVENTSSVPVYIRAVAFAEWRNEAGGVLINAPQEDTDYTIERDGWTELADVTWKTAIENPQAAQVAFALPLYYYYYNGAVASGETVQILNWARTESEAPAEDAHLVFTVVAEAIQAAGGADGEAAAKDAWGYSWDGTAWS